MTPIPFRIIPCTEWGAAPPRHPIDRSLVKVDGALVHHTAGHHPNLDASSGESYAEAIAYAKAIQASHFSRGWADTGNNFLITRNGYIFEGRHRSAGLLLLGTMPQSAHCPGQNGSSSSGHAKIGVEWEHFGHEPATPIQYRAAVWLYAQIVRDCNLKPAAIWGHRDFYATDCPDVLEAVIPKLRQDVAIELKQPQPGPKPVPNPSPKKSGHWHVTKTFYDGRTKVDTTGSLRLWVLKQGNLRKKGVRKVQANWVETG